VNRVKQQPRKKLEILLYPNWEDSNKLISWMFPQMILKAIKFQIVCWPLMMRFSIHISMMTLNFCTEENRPTVMIFIHKILPAWDDWISKYPISKEVWFSKLLKLQKMNKKGSWREMLKRTDNSMPRLTTLSMKHVVREGRLKMSSLCQCWTQSKKYWESSSLQTLTSNCHSPMQT
jgi:hypothetical protein